MMIIKRSGEKEPVAFDKITTRISKLCYNLDKSVSAAVVAQKVITGVYDGVTTMALDDLAAETAAYLTTQHPDYARLAARISVSNLHKMTDNSFASTMDKLHDYINPRNGQKAPLISDDVWEIIMANKDFLDAAIIYDRDFEYDYFGFKTLEKSYLLKMVRTATPSPTASAAPRPQPPHGLSPHGLSRPTASAPSAHARTPTPAAKSGRLPSPPSSWRAAVWGRSATVGRATPPDDDAARSPPPPRHARPVPSMHSVHAVLRLRDMCDMCGRACRKGRHRPLPLRPSPHAHPADATPPLRPPARPLSLSLSLSLSPRPPRSTARSWSGPSTC